jgi:5-methyltetrahydrofolate--homocysteine methyltransferase
MSSIHEAITKNILILDGAGNHVATVQFLEEDFRGERFKDFPHSLKGNNDLLSLTQPQL